MNICRFISIVFCFTLSFSLNAQEYSARVGPESIRALPGEPLRFVLVVENSSDTELCFTTFSDSGKYYMELTPQFNHVVTYVNEPVGCAFTLNTKYAYRGEARGAVTYNIAARSNSRLVFSSEIVPSDLGLYDGRKLKLKVKLMLYPCNSYKDRIIESTLDIPLCKLSGKEIQYWNRVLSFERKRVKLNKSIRFVEQRKKKYLKCESCPLIELYELQSQFSDSIYQPELIRIVSQKLLKEKNMYHYKELKGLYWMLLQVAEQNGAVNHEEVVKAQNLYFDQ